MNSLSPIATIEAELSHVRTLAAILGQLDTIQPYQAETIAVAIERAANEAQAAVDAG